MVSFICSISLAGTFYVSPSGSDSNAGTEAAPWQTIGHAESTASPGSTIYLRGGDYGDVVVGSTSNYGRIDWDDAITFTEYVGETPHFDSLTITGNYSRYLIFDNIEMQEDFGNGANAVVTIENSDYIKIQNCEIMGWDELEDIGGSYPAESATGFCIDITGSNSKYIYIDNNYMHDCRRITRLDANHDGNIWYTNNQMYDASGSIMQFEYNGAVGGTVYIHDNDLWNSQRLWNSGEESDHSSGISLRMDNMDIRRNVIRSTGGSSLIKTYYGTAVSYYVTNGFSNIVIENNLFYAPWNEYFMFDFDYLGTGFKFNNNTVVGRHSTTAPPAEDDRTGRNNYGSPSPRWQLNGSFPVSMADAEFCNNVWVGCLRLSPNFLGHVKGNIAYSWFADGAYRDATWLASNMPDNTCYTDSSSYEPLVFETDNEFFVGGWPAGSSNPYYRAELATGTTADCHSLGQFKLAVGSAAIGYGDATYAPTYDIEGNTRGGGDGIEAGCYEFQYGADTTAPTLVSVTVQDATTIDLLFSEDVVETDAETTGNYALDNSETISSATLQTDDRTVRLVTSTLDEGTQYTLTVNNINDLSSNTIATDSTIQFTYNSPLVVRYQFNEGVGTTAGDSSSNGNNLTLYGTPSWDASGAISTGALAFDGTDDYGLATADSSFQWDGSITLSAWVKIDSTGTEAYPRIIDNGTVNTGWSWYVVESDLSMKFMFYATGSVQSNANMVVDDTWTRVAFVYDDATGTYTFYKDGVAHGTGSVSGSLSNTADLAIGHRHFDTARHFKGSIDEVRVYDIALTQGEVDALDDEAPTGDTNAPTPDPMTFATAPDAVVGSYTSIVMTASTATDAEDNGVEYYFDATDGGNDSGWQASTTYTDTGLTPNTTYTYRVKARDLSDNLNETAYSSTSAVNTSVDDATAPTWTAGFSSDPAASGTSVSMTANTATDDSASVQYYFDETTGGAGATDSGWQSSPTYTDSGLSASTEYTYRVKVRDTSPSNNESSYSDPCSVTTDAQETTAPSPDPMTFAVDPNGTSDTAISMTATIASDASLGVQYQFEETSGNPGATSSGWQDSPYYIDTGLTADTQYTYKVRAKDTYGNTTAYSDPCNATTLASCGASEPSNLIVYHRFEDGTGSTSTDESSNSIDGTLGGGATWEGTEVNGGSYAAEFGNSNGDRIELGSSATVDFTGDMTIVCWFYLTGQGDDNTIVSKTDGSNGWMVIEDGGLIKCWFEAGTPNIFSVNPSLTTSTWYKLYVTYDQSDSAWEIWIDGTKYTDGSDGGTADYNADATLVIGAERTNGYNPFNGYIDDLRIYNRELDKTEMDTITADETFGGGSCETDQTAPTPNPATFTTDPAADSDTAISMTATTGTDDGTVNYKFVEITGNSGATDSDWQASASYTDSGLSQNTQYGYQVYMRDDSSNLNMTAPSDPCYATTNYTDTTAPTPDPMTFASDPAAASYSSITMTATTASDASGVEYKFTETTGNSGGTTSDWQDSTSYTDTGLSENTTYTYTVTARDKSAGQNTTTASDPCSATTPYEDVTAPTPDPMTFALDPNGVSLTSITMQATTATDTQNSVQYYFTCTSGDAPDSGWQSGTVYTVTGLDPNTSYTFTVKARDTSTAYNETAASDPCSATTWADTIAPTPNPMSWQLVPYATDVNAVSMECSVATDPSGGIMYYFDETSGNSGGTDSGWQESPTYSDTGLTASTTYIYRVKAKDTNGNETTYSSSKSVTTNAPASENNAPVLASIGTKNGYADELLSFQVSATDADGDSLTYSATGLPSGATFNTFNRYFYWRPTDSQAGAHLVTFTVDDGTDTDSEIVTMNITATNQPPSILYTLAITVGRTLQFEVVGSDDGSYNTRVKELPPGATFSGGIFTWTPTTGAEGIWEVEFIAEDDAGATDSQVVIIYVQGA